MDVWIKLLVILIQEQIKKLEIANILLNTMTVMEIAYQILIVRVSVVGLYLLINVEYVEEITPHVQIAQEYQMETTN